MPGHYFAKRIVTMVITLIVILHFQFVFFWVINPVTPVPMVIDPNFTPELQEYLTKLYGLDQPLQVKYAKYMENMLTFNFGLSFGTRQPVAAMLADFLPNTLVLVISAVAIQIALGISAGLYAAMKRGRIGDFSVIGLGLVMAAVPSFLTALVFRYVFAEQLRWFPIFSTMLSPPSDMWEYFIQFMYRLALPLATLVCIGFGGWAFYTRNLSMDAMTQDFVQTARAKGAEEKRVLFRHVFPAILAPVVTLIAVGLPGTIFGSIVIEYVFTWKGIGWLYLTSTLKGDYPVVQSLFFIYTIMLLLGNFLADFLYGYLDPRVRVGVRR